MLEPIAKDWLVAPAASDALINSWRYSRASAYSLRVDTYGMNGQYNKILIIYEPNLLITHALMSHPLPWLVFLSPQGWATQYRAFSRRCSLNAWVTCARGSTVTVPEVLAPLIAQQCLKEGAIIQKQDSREVSSPHWPVLPAWLYMLSLGMLRIAQSPSTKKRWPSGWQSHCIAGGTLPLADRHTWRALLRKTRCQEKYSLELMACFRDIYSLQVKKI